MLEIVQVAFVGQTITYTATNIQEMQRAILKEWHPDYTEDRIFCVVDGVRLVCVTVMKKNSDTVRFYWDDCVDVFKLKRLGDGTVIYEQVIDQPIRTPGAMGSWSRTLT